MPRYDYQCPGCGAVKEVIHTMAECQNPGPATIAEITCPGPCALGPAGSAPLRMVRTINAPAIGEFAGATPQQRKATLLKRSREHYQTTIKEQRHELTKKVVRDGRI